MFSVFVGIKGNAKELNLPGHNTWLFPHWCHEQSVEAYRQSLSGESLTSTPYLPLVFVSFSSGLCQCEKL